MRSLKKNLKNLMIVTLLFLSSCAGSVRITGRGCTSKDAQFVNRNVFFKPNKTWQKKVWSFGGEADDVKSFSLAEIMAEKEIDCRQIAYVRYKIGQSFWDQIFSFIPFMQRTTIEVEVQTKS